MPSAHRSYGQWNVERFLSWAGTIGKETREMIQRVLKSRPHPEQSYRTCMGILSLRKQYGEDRLNKACARALSVGMSSYRRIRNILERGLEGEGHPELELQMRALPDHENVRGGRYYH